VTARRKLKRIVAPSRAKKALGAKTEAEVVRLSVERVAEMKSFGSSRKKPAVTQAGKRGENLRWPWSFLIPHV
jgi:hypothetical protein